jgi:hypothetical protein
LIEKTTSFSSGTESGPISSIRTSTLSFMPSPDFILIKKINSITFGFITYTATAVQSSVQNKANGYKAYLNNNIVSGTINISIPTATNYSWSLTNITSIDIKNLLLNSLYIEGTTGPPPYMYAYASGVFKISITYYG